MSHFRKFFFVTLPFLILPLLVCVLPTMGNAEEVRLASSDIRSNLSLRNEVQHAVDKGLQWLKDQQSPRGFWSQPEYPALSGLVLMAFMGEPSGRFRATPPEFIRRGYDYILQCVRPDGGIYVKDLESYNTSVCMMALQVANNSAYEKTLRKARNHVAGLQQGELDETGKTDSAVDGGVGYGTRYKHSDMSNTVLALEALYYTKYLAQDAGEDHLAIKELNWPAVIQFIQRSQNLPGYNDQPWASDDPRNKGGFVYFPGDSKAGEETLPSGKKALRSYGSISYAGLLSYIYAELDREDPRVKAAYDWLRRNYTLEENPGMGPQGLFYYYHTMAKALSAYGVQDLVMEDGRKINWRNDLALKLLDLQKSDGTWVNDNGRWWEKDPVLVTAYALITMEILYRGL